ncbi:MAG: hypothetical protein Q9208_003225 [Pyrenodesmia sp. 3 TL-2023]
MSEPSDNNASDSLSPPTRGRQRSGGNDSLWKRARKTLGTNSLTFLQPQNKPAATKAEDPTGSSPGKTTPGKRREQVRNAQRYVGPSSVFYYFIHLFRSLDLRYTLPRSPVIDDIGSTHRQRTQNYIKTLESEVLRLRGSEGDLTTANRKLQNQVDLLQNTLARANLPLPAGCGGSSLFAQSASVPSNMPATVAFKTDNLNHERLHVTWPGSPPQQPAPPHRHQPAQPHHHQPGQPQQQQQQQQQQPQLPQQPSFDNDPNSMFDVFNRDWYGVNQKPLPDTPHQSSTLTPLDFPSATYENPLPGMASKLDTPEVAVDFVLALEHPCMPHLPHPSDPPSEDPSNHALLFSAPLVSRAPKTFKQPDASWQANGFMIKELLNLSSAINLEGEITPVEAWQRLRQHPGFGRLDNIAFDRIKAELSTSARCCGFGTVIDEDAFDYTLESILGPA